ncbi:single-stranded DNA-binding protein [Nocardia wallacei]|uniref:single-stranded DNA-binding protein n=1 Tax=Nocardia wallacei TaxID=480035 RepID=UPI002454201F|nr:single-stranded DNA-binding protein [Nocardia wallacei]
MYEANTAVIGTVVTHPVRRSLPGGEQVVTFRMASNARRFDRDRGEWVDNGSLFITINCWRRLVEGVDASLRRGDPIVAYGQLRTNEYRTKDGAQRQDLEMRASALGPDLGRCTATVVRRRSGNSAEPPAVDSAADGGLVEPDVGQPLAAAPADPG